MHSIVTAHRNLCIGQTFPNQLLNCCAIHRLVTLDAEWLRLDRRGKPDIIMKPDQISNVVILTANHKSARSEFSKQGMI